jgi:hypothetical protein
MLNPTPRDDRPIDIEAYLAALPPAPVGNGGPPLDQTPFQALEKIGQAAFGTHWRGKLCDQIGEDPRNARRWRDGQGQPSERTVGWAKEWARQTAQALLAAAGEDDLSEAVARRQSDLKRAASERGRDAMLAARQAAAPQSPDEN